MMNADQPEQSDLLKAAGVLIAICAVAIVTIRSLDSALWSDEVLTVILVQAGSLPKLWAGIVSGIDGNPPLYLTAGWLLVHAMPAMVSTVGLLKIANVLVTAAATFALYRVSLRVVSALAAWTAAFVFAATSSNLLFVALELRTYAIFFLLSALAVLFQQRLIEHGRTRDIVVLALILAALTMAHTFGAAYVACIVIAGWLSQDGHGWRQSRGIVFATLPAVIVWVAWLPFFYNQSLSGRPYFWTTAPSVSELLQVLFASPLAMVIALIEIFCLLVAAIRVVVKSPRSHWLSRIRQPGLQPYRYLTVVLAAILAFTLAVWIGSVMLFPLFVPRYLTPQLIVSFALHVAFCEWLVRLMRKRGYAGFAGIATILVPVLFCATVLSADTDRGPVACAGTGGKPFESDFISGELPVIAESPHVYLPRLFYSAHAAAYRYPLDWDVVIAYPQRARGNATDFHVMESLKEWSASDAIQSTEEIIGTSPQFLAIEQSGRAWFHNLRNTRDVTAEKLAEVTSPDGGTCTLWKVTSVTARR